MDDEDITGNLKPLVFPHDPRVDEANLRLHLETSSPRHHGALTLLSLKKNTDPASTMLTRVVLVLGLAR
jgi:hypothetical protein